MESLALLSSERFLLELILKGTLLMAMAFAISFVLQKASAALRHAVWSMAFVGLLLLPICAEFLPAWHVTLPEFSAVEGLLSETSTALAVENQHGEEVVAEPFAPVAPDVLAPAGVAGEPPATATDPLASASLDLTWSWTNLALLLWIAVAIVLFIRMALVLNQLSLLRRTAKPVTDPDWTHLAEILPAALGIRRPVLFLQHDEIVVPMTYGVRRPVIFLPLGADRWSEDQKHVTLVHELLHVRRFDHLFHILALLARALYWFNPLTWAAAKRLVVERERACDDGVIAMGVPSTSYADHLLEMARYVLSGKEVSTGALAMARPTELRGRIVAILNPGQPRQALTRQRAFSIAGCTLIFVALVAAIQPGRGATQKDGNPIERTALSDRYTAGLEFDYSTGAGDHPAAGAEFHDSDSPGFSGTIHVESRNAVGAAQNSAASAESMSRSRQVAVGLHADDDGADGIAMSLMDDNDSDTTDVEAQRRAIHAISQLPRERSIPLLQEIAETHSNAELREDAVFWLGDVGGGSTADLLESFARNDASQNVQKKAIFALSEIEGDAGVARLVDLAKTHPNPSLQADAVFWLSQADGHEIPGILADFARTGTSREIQKKAVFGLSEIDDAAGVEYLIDLAKSHPDPDVRSEAVFWLGETGDPRAVDVLMEIVNER